MQKAFLHNAGQATCCATLASNLRQYAPGTCVKLHPAASSKMVLRCLEVSWGVKTEISTLLGCVTPSPRMRCLEISRDLWLQENDLAGYWLCTVSRLASRFMQSFVHCTGVCTCLDVMELDSVYMCVCMCVCVRVNECECVYACVCVCICVCVYVCMCVRLWECTF